MRNNEKLEKNYQVEMKTTCICPYCDAKARPFLSAGDVNRRISDQVFTYSKCTDCGLVFIDEIPKNIASFYAGGYQPIPASLTELQHLAKTEKYRLEPILRHKGRGKLLELGPWIGIFSSNAKDAGFDVTAVDMNNDCVEFLQNVLGIRAFQSDDPAAAVANLDDRFDVVVLWHCLEHFPKPWEVIKQISRVLQPGGVLLVALPNIESYEFSVLKSSWTHIDAPRHLHFYPLASLTALCSANELSCVEATTSDQLSRMLRRSSWHAWGKGLVPWSPFVGRAFGVVMGRLAGFVIGSAGRREGAGAGLTAVYRKNTSSMIRKE